jgi:hypothetical protein
MIRNKMDKSQKVKVYQWCRDNKDNSGAQYPKVLKMTHYDYLSMKSNLRKRIPYADYTIVVNEGNYKQLQFFIR